MIQKRFGVRSVSFCTCATFVGVDGRARRAAAAAAADSVGCCWSRFLKTAAAAMAAFGFAVAAVKGGLGGLCLLEPSILG